METIYNIARGSFEMLYFVGGIILAIVAIMGIKQLKIALEQLRLSFKQVEIGVKQVSIGIEQITLLKHDIETRNTRQSIEKAIEFIQRFKEKIFPLRSNLSAKYNELNYTKNKLEITDIDEFPFKDETEIKQAAEKAVATKPDDLFNELELFSSAFVSRLANEDLAFQPLGQIFIKTIEEYYDVFCICRVGAPYANTIQLYKIWKSRLSKMELDKQINKLEATRSQIQETRITPIGLEIQKSEDI